jgi:hypothetical protein
MYQDADPLVGRALAAVSLREIAYLPPDFGDRTPAVVQPCDRFQEPWGQAGGETHRPTIARRALPFRANTVPSSFK